MNDNQATRVLQIIRILQDNPTLNIKAICKELYPEDDEAQLKGKSRQTQRTLDILSSEGFVNKELISRRDGATYSLLGRIGNPNKNSLNIRGEETLAFYFVSAFIDLFEGTQLAENFNRFRDLIEHIAPEEFIPEVQLLQLNIPGLFQFNITDNIINPLITSINKAQWITISHHKQNRTEIKDKIVLPVQLSFYEGILYLIAYSERRRKYLTYSVHNIIQCQESLIEYTKPPKFDSDAFNRERFAVIEGKLEEIKLTINPEMKYLFDKRKWHMSQVTSYDSQRRLIIEFKSPITDDLIWWVIHWISAFDEIKPIKLKEEVINKMKSNIDRLKKSI